MSNEDPLANASTSLLLGTASDIVSKVSEKTTVFDSQRDSLFPRFDDQEVVPARVLGRGGFCVVNEVAAMELIESSDGAEHERRKHENKDTKAEQPAYNESFSRKFIQSRCRRNNDARYAVKKLSDPCKADSHLFLKGTIDLAVEARFLAVLEHPHIIKMRAVSSKGPFDEGFFIVLDRLYDTLEQRFRKWKSNQSNGLFSALCGARKKQKKLEVERIMVAHDLSCAMKYMHKNNIIYRDLKPDNIGFDVRGDVKIFDMGLAKELRSDEKDADGTYKLTGYTGSLRYMAPEIAKDLPYNLSADVYSFGILFWQIMSLEPPFADYSCKMQDKLVFHKGYRPAVKSSWPSECSALMKKCWSPKLSDRPTFEEVSEILANVAEELGPDRVFEDLDVSARSLKGATNFHSKPDDRA